MIHDTVIPGDEAKGEGSYEGERGEEKSGSP
jgi:hypothetical protein